MILINNILYTTDGLELIMPWIDKSSKELKRFVMNPKIEEIGKEMEEKNSLGEGKVILKKNRLNIETEFLVKKHGEEYFRGSYKPDVISQYYKKWKVQMEVSKIKKETLSIMSGRAIDYVKKLGINNLNSLLKNQKGKVSCEDNVRLGFISYTEDGKKFARITKFIDKDVSFLVGDVKHYEIELILKRKVKEVRDNMSRFQK